MIGGIIQGIGNIISGAQQQSINNQNLQFQKEQFDYQKELNDRAFNYQKEQNDITRQREDTAIQRRVEDLNKAGMSKWLAAGQGASSTAVTGAGNQTSASAPQMSGSHLETLKNTVSDSVNVIGALQNVKNLKSQELVNKAQAINIGADTTKKNAETQTEINHRRQQIDSSTRLNDKQKEVLDSEMRKIQSQIDNLNAQTSEQLFDNYINQTQMTRSNDPTNSIYNSVKTFIGEGIRGLDGAKQILKSPINKAKNFFKKGFFGK